MSLMERACKGRAALKDLIHSFYRRSGAFRHPVDNSCGISVVVRDLAPQWLLSIRLRAEHILYKGTRTESGAGSA